MASSYKCPACGAPIEYKPEKQLFACDYCLSQYTEQQIIDYFATEDAKKEASAIKQKERDDKRAEQASDFGTEAVSSSVNSYHCDSCGATVVTDTTTTSTFCYYCHQPVIISERLAGDFKPDQMIPFRMNKEQAKEAFLKWVGTRKYVPSDFTKAEHLEQMTGVYLPFWFADADVDFQVAGSSNDSRSWTSGNVRYTETSYYQHLREGSLFLDDTSILAYTKVDPDLLNNISVYDLSQMRPFAMPMLSGFFADKYDVTAENSKNKLADQAHGYSMQKIFTSFQSAAGQVKLTHENVDIHLRDLLYTLLPTWMLTYKFKDKIYIFAMNGQSGEVVGELPYDKSRLMRDCLIIAAIALVIMLIGGFFIW